MNAYWFGVVVGRVPDDCVDGLVRADGLTDEGELDSADLQYLVLGRARALTLVEAERLIGSYA